MSGTFKFRCDQCVFWESTHLRDENDPDSDAGECHRKPPVLDPIQTDMMADPDSLAHEHHGCWVFPVTEANNWCGEFQPMSLDENMH